MDGPPVFRLRCSTPSSAAARLRQLSTAAHAFAPLDLPQAARDNAANPNTEVKHMYADDSCRVTGCENR